MQYLFITFHNDNPIYSTLFNLLQVLESGSDSQWVGQWILSLLVLSSRLFACNLDVLCGVEVQTSGSEEETAWVMEVQIECTLEVVQELLSFTLGKHFLQLTFSL